MSALPSLHVVDDATSLDTTDPGPQAPSLLARRAEAHRVRAAAQHGPFAAFGPLGPLAVRDADVPALVRALPEADPDDDAAPLDVTVVVSGGAGAIEPAARWAERASGLRLRGLLASVRDLDDLARGAHRIAAMVQMLGADAVIDDDVVVEVALPLDARGPAGARWEHALDTLALEDLRLALRTGGAWSEAPDPTTLAAAIGEALDREIAFVCHGGLEGAVGTSGPGAGYGFADVLLATRASLDGAAPDEVAARLTEQRTLESTRAELDAIGAAGVGSAARWFSGFSSVDVDATVADLAAVGLGG
ncbi:hypothetical protein CLV56_4046 [Mumia flava]|uniref:Uncharacterized protein n=1 Tax=Mumia flava TaxID=1348852 RepID=A0A0B2B0Q6_9ACTN|nr:hypothetical protein [Mumia flava]PJJ48170.1 hypothetical protein CLV56_4046 [Mumia flava]